MDLACNDIENTINKDAEKSIKCEEGKKLLCFGAVRVVGNYTSQTSLQLSRDIPHFFPND